RDDFLGARRHDGRDRQIGTGQDDGVRDHEIARVEGVPDLQGGDVELDAIGDVLGQHFDFDFAGDLVEHAAGVAHAVGRSHEVDWDFERDFLVRLDLVEVYVD